MLCVSIYICIIYVYEQSTFGAVSEFCLNVFIHDDEALERKAPLDIIISKKKEIGGDQMRVDLNR